MKLQRVYYQLSAEGPSLWGAAVVTEYDGKVKYIIGENSGLLVYDKWYCATLDRGPMAYMNTVPEPSLQQSEKA